MEEDWLSKCVIDPSKRKVYLYSEGGEKRTVDCDTVQEFMNVLNFIRSTTSEDMISYAEFSQKCARQYTICKSK
jgi:hypothetical protein